MTYFLKKMTLFIFLWKKLFFFLVFFVLFRAALEAYGGSQPSGPIGAVATGHSHSHSHARSKLGLWPTQQLTATPDP